MRLRIQSTVLRLGVGAFFLAAWPAPLFARDVTPAQAIASAWPKKDMAASRAKDALDVETLEASALTRLGRAQRLQAAELLSEGSSAHGLMLLWILAHDPDSDIQALALRSAVLRCREEQSFVCAASLAFFMDDDADVCANAREALLLTDPYRALQSASREYKLEVVSLMAGKVGQPLTTPALWRVLVGLADDPDAEVQQAAGVVLLNASR